MLLLIRSLRKRHKISIFHNQYRPKYVQKVEGEGMPIPQDDTKAENYNKPLKRGDLYVKFDIVFPNSLNEAQKKGVKQHLSNI